MREYNPSVGEVWVNRKGERFTILSVSVSSEMPINAISDNKRILSFTREGYFIGKQFPNPMDLVEKQ